MKEILEEYLKIGKEMGISQGDLIDKNEILINPVDLTYLEINIHGKEKNGLTPILELHLKLGNKKLNGKIPTKLDDLSQVYPFVLHLSDEIWDPLAVIDFPKKTLKSAKYIDGWDKIEDHFKGLSEEGLIKKLLEFYKNGPPEKYKD